MTTTIRASALFLALLVTAPARAAFESPALGDDVMVATGHPLATEAGLSILKQGGNAVDAAIASTLAISVTLPLSAGIGGGGFALVHLEKEGQMKALDFREKAPAKATRDMFLGPDGKVKPGASVDGYLSVGVPGTIAGLKALHDKHGKLAWAKLVAPAIAIARDGFIVGERFEGASLMRQEVLSRFAPTRAAFFKKKGAKVSGGGEVPLVRGDRLVQRDLAKTLEAIARDPATFYTGKVAKLLVDDVQKNGGLLSLEDLKGYQPTWREPVCGDYRGTHLCAMPPPSSGGVHVLEILNLVRDTELGARPWHDVDGLHRLVEATRIAYADRAEHLGDPGFYPVPTAALIGTRYADKRKGEIDMKRARPSLEVKAATAQQLKESNDTSHLTVVDGARNAVSLTFTVNYAWGSGAVAAGTGILLNDEMDDFSAAPGVPNAYGLVGGEANAVAPHKIPLSSMTPLIGTREGHFALTAGSMGGSTIITQVLQVVVHVLDFKMDAQAAVAAPRFHHQWLPDELRVETFGFDAATKKALEDRGHRVRETPGWGNAMAIVKRPDGVLEGGADPRGEGLAKGY